MVADPTHDAAQLTVMRLALALTTGAIIFGFASTGLHLPLLPDMALPPRDRGRHLRW